MSTNDCQTFVVSLVHINDDGRTDLPERNYVPTPLFCPKSIENNAIDVSDYVCDRSLGIAERSLYYYVYIIRRGDVYAAPSPYFY